jgi:hypothetical protein
MNTVHPAATAPMPQPIYWMPNAIVGQGPPAPAPAPTLPQLGSAIRAGFRELTPALIITGIAIGVASGLGSTIGTALGTFFVDRFGPRRSRRR